MGDDKDKIVALLLRHGGVPGEDSRDEDERDAGPDDADEHHGPDPDLVAVSEELIDAVRRGSPRGVATALDAAFAVCSRYTGGR